MDKNLRIIKANQSFYQTFQTNQKDTENKFFFELGNGQLDIPKLRLLLEKVLYENTQFSDFEVEHTFPNIGRKIMLLNARRINLDENLADTILLAIDDITHLKELDKRKDEFISMASHELKTPIATIKGFSQILQQNLQRDKRSNYFLSKMYVQIERLAALVNDLLDVSKIQAGKLKLNKTKFKIDNLVKDVVEDMQPILKKHQIIIKGSTKDKVFADKYRIGQVLTNLISNAVKFSPKSNKVITTITSSKQYIIVSVQDFGIGISEKDKLHIFESFFQASNRIRQSFSGLGLGLYISSQIIQRHQGKIWVDSERGVGSKFSFRLPIYKERKT